jgi:hypothetical protein
MVGYFINRGALLYRDVFFIHQPLAELISALVQQLTHPVNIYDLVLKHRQALWIFSYFWVILMSVRFGAPALIFSILYEPVKYYFFGDRYLGESFTVYPVAYLIFLLFSPPKSAFSKIIDSVFAAIGAFIGIFEREPYVPVSILLYISVLFISIRSKFRLYSILLFSVMTLSLLSYLPLKNYYFNVVTVNQATLIKGEIGNSNFILHNILPALFYPFKLFLPGGDWTIVRYYQMVLIVTLIILYLKEKPKPVITAVMIMSLILANLRSTNPGKMYYEAFHMLVWLSVVCALTAILWGNINTKFRYISGFLILIIAGLFFINKSSFIHEKFDPHSLYMTNYGPTQFYGMVIKSISGPGDTLFVDGADDLVYWAAGIPAAYKFKMFTSVMPAFDIYLKSRFEMFQNYPPSFYYGSCPESPSALKKLPPDQINNYVRLTTNISPTCLWISKIKYDQITTEQWKMLSDKYQITPILTGSEK